MNKIIGSNESYESYNSYDSYIEYLSSKRSVDDRSLNVHVWNSFAGNLKRLKSPEIIEIGGGIGTMISRLIENNVLSSGNYLLLDADQKLIDKARQNLIDMPINIDFTVSLINDFIKNKSNLNVYDFLIANAFLDIIDIKSALPGILELLKPGGFFYFTVNFDGRTDFEPVIDGEFDLQVIEQYHLTMDERQAGINKCTRYTGKLLFNEILKNNCEMIEAGSSDWTVFPRGKKYGAREDYFLHFIINTIHNALKNCKEMPQRKLDDWIRKRHAQVENGELIYITHQMDFFGRTYE